MPWVTCDDVRDFLAAADEFLRASPAANTTLLTVAQALVDRGPAVFGVAPPVFGTWRGPAGEVTGAFLRTPPYPLLVSQIPAESAGPLVAVIGQVGGPAPVVNADLPTADLLTEAWASQGGTRVTDRQRLYRLGALVPPPRPPGAARVATTADEDLALAWFDAFGRELGQDPADSAGILGNYLAEGGLVLWETVTGPVSMAALSGPIAGMTRISSVYTPPDLRRRGYAGAVTAAASQAALDRGAAEVLLFTDLANPTSNALYQRMGYEAVADRVLMSLDRDGPRDGGRAD